MIKSLARMMLYGSQVFLVVFTFIDPSIKFNSAIILNFFSSFLTRGQISLIYFSLYYGNKQEKLDSSTIPVGLSSGVNFSIFHLSRFGSLSQGFSFLNLLFLLTASCSFSLFFYSYYSLSFIFTLFYIILNINYTF